MINKKTVCSYCNRAHDIGDDQTICDYVVISYPLYSTAQQDAQHAEMASNYFQEEIKALKNDYVILNTLKVNAEAEANKLRTDLDLLHKELRLIKSENSRLRAQNEIGTDSEHG